MGGIFGTVSPPRILARTGSCRHSACKSCLLQTFYVVDSYAMVERTRLTMSYSYAIILIVIFALFFYGIIDRNSPASTLITLGLGAVDPRAFIYGWKVPHTGTSGLLSNVLIANSPQVILSSIYYVYNSLFTCFMLGAEWNNYASQRRGLRVSAGPQGHQRTTYFLQLPYRWAIPLMVLSGTLHWLCSQSIFLVNIQFDHVQLEHIEEVFVVLQKENFMTCGYSPSAMLATITLGICMVCFAIAMGKRKFKNDGMPVVGSCSASISACCHVLDETAAELHDPDISSDISVSQSKHTTEESNNSLGSSNNITVPQSHDNVCPRVSPLAEDGPESGEKAACLSLQWGVTTAIPYPDKPHVRHCAFSSRPVRSPTKGEYCA